LVISIAIVPVTGTRLESLGSRTLVCQQLWQQTMTRISKTDPTLEPELVRLAARVKRLREERGQTLDQLAALSSLSKTYLSRIESGERQPSVAVMFALARAWDVPISALFDEDPEVDVVTVERHAVVDWNGDADGDGYIRVGSGMVEGPYNQ